MTLNDSLIPTVEHKLYSLFTISNSTFESTLRYLLNTDLKKEIILVSFVLLFLYILFERDVVALLFNITLGGACEGVTEFALRSKGVIDVLIC